MIDFSQLQIDSPRFRPGSPRAWLVAGLIVVIATALRAAADLWIGGFPFVLSFPAVVLVTFLCGSAAGLASALLFVLSAWLFILPADMSTLALYQTAMFATGAVTVVAVVSAMRKATAARLASEEKFRGLLEAAPDAMVIVDGLRRIVLVNAGTETLFGYERRELLGRPLDMLLQESQRAAYAARFTELMAQPAAARRRVVDLEAVRRDGAVFPIEVSIGAIRVEAGFLVANAIRDITARKEVEARLVETSKAKSQFLASMSHELRTPLNAIIGFSEVIRDGIVGPLDDRYREYGGDIADAGKHLQKIIDDILDISKIESGRLELRDDVVSIGETLETCRRMVEPMAATAGVAVQLRLPGPLPLLHVDQLRLQQILLNLTSNAVKFTPAQGRVTVSAAVEAEGVVIAVADTGIGMSAQDVAVALQPFRQVDGALSRRFAGTGLGLPLAKALVELHSGRLDIESTPGAGTTVRIRLPLQRVLDVAA